MLRANKTDKGFRCLDPELEKLLPAYLDDGLDAEHRKVFQAHLKFCERCSYNLRLRREITSLIREKWPQLSPDRNNGR